MMQDSPMMAGMMNGMMDGGGWMMLIGGLVWILIIAVLLLGIAALVKYLRSGPPRS